MGFIFRSVHLRMNFRSGGQGCGIFEVNQVGAYKAYEVFESRKQKTTEIAEGIIRIIIINIAVKLYQC